jgi:succinyl-CoA synthetase alpha subunit
MRNLYRDSVSLMQLSATLGALPDVESASATMATPANLALLRESALVPDVPAARPNDVLIAVRAKNERALHAALEAADQALRAEPVPAAKGSSRTSAPRSIAMARAGEPRLNLALVSTPGEYAAAEAMKALRLGLNVMLFSDNIGEDHEVELKRCARRKGLMVMGPDCGTAIINGVPIAFANVVRRGEIGCVAASGTGLQQVTCLVDRLGLGISQAIGTGGHDLSKAVGGITMLQGIEALGADPMTKVIVLISKPPAPKVASKVIKAAARLSKPVVVNFIGADTSALRATNLHRAQTLEDAAFAAVALAKGRKPGLRRATRISLPRSRFSAEQRYLRGLYSGGTFCYEASMLLGGALGKVWSNAPVRSEDRLPNAHRSREHTLVDLGDDQFTRGRPHPMIDHRVRNERIVAEAMDRQTAVILLDVVLGHGAHPNPAEEMLPAIETARARAARGKRWIEFVAFICGTRADPQGLLRQEKRLREAGVLLASSNAGAVRLARDLITRLRDR